MIIFGAIAAVISAVAAAVAVVCAVAALREQPKPDVFGPPATGRGRVAAPSRHEPAAC